MPQQAPLADLSAYKAAYAPLDPVTQFTALNQLFMQAANNTYVRDALVGALHAEGLQLPISKPDDQAQPNDAYKAISGEARWNVYEKTFRAIEAVSRAG